VLAYHSGLRTIAATQAAIVATIEPVVALGLGAAVQGERLSAMAVSGGTLVLGEAAWSTRET
jgi:drug/metabolite transporter, DME family